MTDRRVRLFAIYDHQTERQQLLVPIARGSNRPQIRPKLPQQLAQPAVGAVVTRPGPNRSAFHTLLGFDVQADMANGVVLRSSQYHWAMAEHSADLRRR